MGFGGDTFSLKPGTEQTVVPSSTEHIAKLGKNALTIRIDDNINIFFITYSFLFL